MNFQVNLIFQSSRSSYIPKSRDKNLNILRTKKAFKMNKKAFFVIFKGFSIKQITQAFLEGESLTLSITFQDPHNRFCCNHFVIENLLTDIYLSCSYIYIIYSALLSTLFTLSKFMCLSQNYYATNNSCFVRTRLS